MSRHDLEYVCVYPAPQHLPDVALPPASPEGARTMYDIEVFDPMAPRQPAHAAAALIQRAYRAARAHA